jgi:E3 ubiquitin ligase
MRNQRLRSSKGNADATRSPDLVNVGSTRAQAAVRQRLGMNVGTITSVSQATPFCVLPGKAFLILAIDLFLRGNAGRTVNVCPALVIAVNGLTVLSLVGVTGGLYLFLLGFHFLARRRLLLNTPPSKIRSASLGLVEVSGLATGARTIPAPITSKPCYLYHTTAWQQRDSNKNQEWEKVADETLFVPFFLDDGTGELLVDPLGADLDLHRDFREEYSASFFSSRNQVPPPVGAFLSRHGVTPARKIRIEECCIMPNNALFAVGTLAENSGLEVRPLPVPAEETRPLVTNGNGFKQRPMSSPSPNIVRLSGGAGPASAGAMTLQGKIAAALTMAGITNPAAWSAAGIPNAGLSVQEAPVTQISPVENKKSDEAGTSSEDSALSSGFNPAPPVVLKKGENNSTFLISWRSQYEVVRSLAWKSALMVWGGGALTLLGIYVLLLQMELL